MDSIPYSHLNKGTLLIASPDVSSSLFARSVILLCEHAPSGSFGVMINKPLDLDIPEEILTKEQLSSPHLEVRAGGPIQTNQMMLLHSSSSIPDQTIEICEGVYLGGDLRFLQESLLYDTPPLIRLCFGYIGWSEGQLEREFLDGQWYLHRASRHHLFETPPDTLWATLLREMGGRYATLSTIPEDLSLN